MWQRRLRAAIAVFVVVFAAIVGVLLHRGQARKTTATPPVRQHPDHVLVRDPHPGEGVPRLVGPDPAQCKP